MAVSFENKPLISVQTVLPSGQVLKKIVTPSVLIRELVLSDARCGADLKAVRRAARIEAACQLGEENGTLRFEDDEYRTICEVFEQPTGGYDPQSARRALPVIEAILAAGR